MLRPPLVLAPIEKQGVGIFPVEYLPLEEMSKAKREGKAKSPTAEDDQRIKLASKVTLQNNLKLKISKCYRIFKRQIQMQKKIKM